MSFFKLLDAQMQPVVSYGAEIWEIEHSAYIIERLRSFAMLGVGIRSPNDLVNGEKKLNKNEC